VQHTRIFDRYTFEEWPEHNRSGKEAEMNLTTNIPIIQMPGGKILTQSYAILRHWARQLGQYDGKIEDEKYFADVICDIVVNCMLRETSIVRLNS